jgi:hypothetical protein
MIEKYIGGNSIDKLVERAQKLVSKNKFSINHAKLPIILEKNISIANILTSPTKIIYVEKFSYKGRAP